MKRYFNFGSFVFDIFNHLFLFFIVIVTLYPFLYVLLASFSDALRLTQHTGLIFKPLGFSLNAYALTFSNPMILRGYLNTLTIVVFGTVLNVFLTTMSAYVLSRRQFRASNFIMMMVTITMFISGGLVPFYLQVRALHLHNTYMAIIFPTAISTFNLLILRNAFAAIPYSLEESARMDGANDMTIYLRIMFPLALPTISVIILYCAVGHWNGWFNAMLFLSKRETWPLQLILREILINNSVSDMLTSVGGTDKEMIGESVKYATIVVATLPILLVYPYLQKYFIHGVLVGSVKE